MQVKIKYCYKYYKRRYNLYGCVIFKIESEVIKKVNDFEKFIKICEEYNADIDNDIFIRQVSNLSSDIKTSVVLRPVIIPKLLKKVALKSRDLKPLGGNVFNCDYLIPMENL
tara:strand:- start:304 stop:639 length:336 start_codon:yes stop_codon:yes gene_type:complete